MSTRPAFLVFDIETVADGRLIQRVRYPDAPELTPVEAVTKYRTQLMEEKGSDFIPHTFQVPVSVAIAKVDMHHRLLDLVTLDAPYFRPQVITQQFWQGWEAYGQPSLVTFNGRGFDVPVLEMAAFRYGITLPAWFKFGAKAWEDPRNRFHALAHIDVQEALTNFGAARLHGGLDLCATLLGKPGKMGTKGHMVQDIWQEGGGERIDNYCRCDALDTYFVFLRLRLLQGFVTLEEERACVAAAKQWIQQQVDAGDEAMAEYLAAFRDWQVVNPEDSPFVPE